MAILWPVPLGLLMGYYAPMLHDLAAVWSPWLATLVFSLSALTAQNDSTLGSQTVSQIMLYVQFPLDGMLVYLLLRRRISLLTVCGQLTCLHLFAVITIALATGSIGRLLTN